MQAVMRLGYVVNQQARSLAGGRSQVIGLLVHELGTSYIAEIIRGIEAELATVSYDLMLYTTHRRKTKEATYVATLTRGMADGLLLVLPRNPEAYLESLRQRRFPYVIIDHHGIDDTDPAVAATNKQGAYAAIRHLINLGHRRIGFVTGALDTMGCAPERLAGYKAALADYGLPLDPQLIQEGDFLQPKAYACAQALLALSPRPTAIFASNDVSAFGVMEAVRDAGLRIPDDISIVGFDDIPHAASVNPPLTTVRQPLAQMGQEATRLLLQYIYNPDRPAQQVDLPTELIVRASTRPL